MYNQQKWMCLISANNLFFVVTQWNKYKPFKMLKKYFKLESYFQWHQVALGEIKAFSGRQVCKAAS